MENNLYSAPKADLSSNNLQDDMPLASVDKRFINMIVDGIGYTLLTVIVLAISSATEMLSWIESLDDTVFGVIVMMIYFIPQEMIWGRSLGKLVTGTKVIAEDGTCPSIGQIFGRTLVRFIPFEAFSFLSGNPRGWHDRWSKTKVVSMK